MINIRYDTEIINIVNTELKVKINILFGNQSQLVTRKTEIFARNARIDQAMGLWY